MKKFFAFVAASLMLVSFVSCDKKGGDEPEPPVDPDAIQISISEGIVFLDQMANEGWWQVMAQNDEYLVSLSNAGSVTKAEGTYDVKDLDLSYSYIKTETDSIGLKSGSVEVKVISKDDITFIGTFEGSDNKKYALNLHYTAPAAKKTVELDLGEGALDEDSYAEYNVFVIQAMASDYSTVLQLFIEGDVVGVHTTADIYLSNSLFGTDNAYQEIYDAKVTITEAAADHYDVLAELLCYNNTLYKISFTLPIEVIIPPTGEQVNVEGLIATYIDDYRDYDGSYLIYFDDDATNPTKEIALNLYGEFEGSFGNDDYDPEYSYYADLQVGKLGLQAIDITATPGNEEGHALYSGYVIANNGIRYNFSVDVPYEDLLKPASAPARKALKKSARASFTGFQAARRGAKVLSK